MRIIAALKHDLKFQFRHGFYYAYLLVSIIYIGLLLSLPNESRSFLVSLIIFSDPAMLGFFFIGGILLLERGEQTLEALFITPLKLREYFIAKVISFSFLALVSSFLIVFISIGFDFNFPLLLIGILLTSIFFTLFGFTLAVRVKEVNQYLILSIPYSILITVPLLGYLNIYDSFLFYLWPTRASLVLISGALLGGVNIWQVLYGILALLIWIGIAYIWAHNCFYKYIILKIGDDK